MAHFYVDSSALVKRHIFETGSAWFHTLVAPTASNTVTTAHISMVEVYSALNRRMREASLDAADYARIIADFDALCVTQYILVELTAAVIERAKSLLKLYPLRAYDAVHLASALLANETLVTSGLPVLVFVSADHRLLIAAQAEGLATENPNVYP
ncbi:MAG: type II toxin-antitoxin system VapC family toxin [Chloroflexales bacterium]|nr:type II toxin-antitoxin system VapC family toxin [Chloroflexales bacterium]